MATFITIKLEENIRDDQKQELRNLFADALYEFRTSRTPIQAYWDKKYGSGRVYATPAERAQKLASINRRNELAELLHTPVLQLDARVVDSSDKRALARRYVKAALNTELEAIVDMAIIDLEAALSEEDLPKDKVQHFLLLTKETASQLKMLIEDACLGLFSEAELEFMTAFFESDAGKAVTGKAADLGNVVDASIDLWRESVSKRAEEMFPTKKNLVTP